MRFVAIVVGVVLALAIQTTILSRLVVRGIVVPDLVLVAVVYVALTSGPTTGMLTGTVAGLIQDALSSSGIWVGGLVKTIVGFLSGIIGTQFIVTQPLPRLVVFFAATLVHAALKMGLYALLALGDFRAQPYGLMLWQAGANAVAGVVAFQLVESVPGAVERRRAARPRLRR